jgi:hypothetical protein
MASDGAWTSNPLGQNYFDKSSVPQNSSHWKTYCKACVQHHVNRLKEERSRQAGGLPTDPATRLANDTADFDLGM